MIVNFPSFSLKGNAAYLKKNYIMVFMDENDSLSEYSKIPLGHNRTNGAVYYKIYFKVEICSALYQWRIQGGGPGGLGPPPRNA